MIPQPADQIANRKRRGRSGGRPPGFEREAYKQRDSVERWINRLKQWRGLATPHEKTATVYRAGLPGVAIPHSKVTARSPLVAAALLPAPADAASVVRDETWRRQPLLRVPRVRRL